MSFRAVGERSPRARKEYRCDLCPHLIQVGQVYATWCSILDGDVATIKVHQACWALLREYGEMGPGGQYYVIDSDALGEAFRWSEPTRESCVQVAGDDGGRVWDLLCGVDS